MPILLTFVLVANAFVAGFFCADAYKPTSLIDYAKRIALLLLLLSFGAVIFIGQFIYDSIVHFWKFLNSQFQIQFFITFYLRNGYRNLDENRIYRFNLRAKERFNTNSFGDMVFRYCVRLVNKRNNYTYTKVA